MVLLNPGSASDFLRGADNLQYGVKFILEDPNVFYFLRLTVRPDKYAYFEVACRSYLKRERTTSEENVLGYLLQTFIFLL